MIEKHVKSKRWTRLACVLSMLLSACAPHGTRYSGHFIPPAEFVLPLASSWRVAVVEPPENWMLPDFADDDWHVHRGGLWSDGRSGTPGLERNYWLRRSFTVDSDQVDSLVFWGIWHDRITIYINGVQANRQAMDSPGYRYLGLNPQARDAISATGNNTLAVRLESDSAGRTRFDLGLTTSEKLTDLPQTGSVDNEALADLPGLVRDFMQLNGIPAGVLAVRQGDRLVVSKGFGYMDREFTRPTPPDAVLRLASNDKPVTEDAVMYLLKTGVRPRPLSEPVTLSTPAFPLLNALGVPLLPEPADPRVDDITIEHLLSHRSGLPPLTGADYQSILRLSGARRLHELDLHDNVAWLYRQKLQFRPGSKKEYSSTGPMLLRYMLHVLTGDLEAFLREALFTPYGVDDIFIAHARPADRTTDAQGAPREPWYATLDASHARWMNLENYTALAASAPAYVHYSQYASQDRLTFGRMPGSWTVTAHSEDDDVSFALFFNIAGKYDDIAEQLLNAILKPPPADRPDASPNAD